MSEDDYREIFSNNLNYYMQKNNTKQIDLVNRFQLSKSAVSNWCNGVKIPRMDKIEMLADYFGITKSDLLEKHYKGPSNIFPIEGEYVKIPVIGRVAAGTGCFAENNIIDYEPIEARDVQDGEDYVFLRVVGDSMYPIFIEGDLVLVRCQTSVDSGSYAVVIIDGEDGVVKKVVYGKDFIELHSINPMYPVRRFENEDVMRIQVFGLVKEIKRKF